MTGNGHRGMSGGARMAPGAVRHVLAIKIAPTVISA